MQINQRISKNFISHCHRVATVLVTLLSVIHVAAAAPNIPAHLSAAGKQAISYHPHTLKNPDFRLLLRGSHANSALTDTPTADAQHLSQPTQDPRSFQMLVPYVDGNIIIDIPTPVLVSETHQVVSHTFEYDGKSQQVIYTQGENTGMGELFADNKHWYFEVDHHGTWLVDITASALLPGLYDDDVVLRNVAHGDGDDAFHQLSSSGSSEVDSNEPTIVDILLVYTPNIVSTYPGEMAQTLLNHLIAKANQTFVDSDINMLLRLVGGEFVDYTKPSNFSALQDLEFALDGDSGTVPDNSVANLGTLRNSLGADIVAMIRTHDLNEREVCGVAYFPDPSSDVLINISNVGISGGSNCLDTFTHEIGHNFGAGHQQNAGNSVGLLDFSGALIVPGQYNTIMSSIGTGDINRDFKLPLFSNLENNCGGKLCGNATTADNARTINQLAAQNAALRAQVLPGTVAIPSKSARDADSDGVSDISDPFPYIATETADSDDDGVGDNSDAFPNNSSESIDTDDDGIGNNADNDDDNDGTPDAQDDLPLDSLDTVDNDGDGVGASRDALDNDFQERFDADSDGIGDRQDTDDDNDGVPDFWPRPTLAQSDVLVVSAGSDALLHFTSSGEFKQAVIEFPDGALSFRSDLLVTPKQQIFMIAFSDVYQFDIQRQELRIAIDRNQLATNFPAHLELDGERLLVGHGLGTSYIDGFTLGRNNNALATSSSSTEVFRDITVFTNNNAYVVSRSSDQIFSISTNRSNATLTLFANQGLSRPEHMVIDSQGRLLVTNALSRDVSRYDTQGNFLGKLITAGSGGLGQIGCITIGPDGDIYLCSTDTHQILKFDGATGAFDSVFIDAGAGNLSQPVSLQFISKAADEFQYDPNHDSDADGVNNPDDAFPLDPNETLDTDNDGIGNNADEDDDNDTMPDSFEIQFGFDPLDPSDASADADNDGVSNAQEFANGTDPTVADAPPPPAPTPQPEPPASSGGGSMGVLFSILLSAVVLRRRLDVKRSMAMQSE